MKFFKHLFLAFLLVAFVSPAFAGNGIAQFDFGPNKFLQLHYLLQIQGYSVQQENAATNDEYFSKDFRIRRSRIILKGKAAENVSFFMETDAPKQEDNNMGKYVFTQDAFIDFAITKGLNIAVGHILLPFMHHNRQSAVSLLSLDYNSAVVPVGGNVWRDNGVEARGIIENGLIDYRVGVFDGTDELGSQNESDMPRLTGRVQLNFADAETGFFYSGNYLGKKKILSVGFGIDYQPDVYRDGTDYKNYMAWTVDAYFDQPVGTNNVLTLQAAYVNVKNSAIKGYDKSSMYFAEAGFLLNGKIQPVAHYYYAQTETSGVKTKVSEIAAGVNYFINGHNANIKAEYAQKLKDESDNYKEKTITVQCQIFI